jgi:hypothetical protein
MKRKRSNSDGVAPDMRDGVDPAAGNGVAPEIGDGIASGMRGGDAPDVGGEDAPDVGGEDAAGISPLLCIPTEILLQVAKEVGGSSRERNYTFRSLSLTCRGLRVIGQEALLIRPATNLYKIRRLVSQLFHNQHLIQRITSLEVTTFSIHKPKERRHWDLVEYNAAQKRKIGGALLQQCRDVIHGSGFKEAKMWLKDLRRDDRTMAMLGILLFVLRHTVKELYFGPSMLGCLPLFDDFVDMSREEEPPSYHCETLGLPQTQLYLLRIMRMYYPVIEALELPSFWHPFTKTFSLPQFSKLQSLTLPGKALHSHFGHPRFDEKFNAHKITHLRIVNASAQIRTFLANHLHYFKRLRQLDVYYVRNNSGDCYVSALDKYLPLECQSKNISLQEWRPEKCYLDAGCVDGRPWVGKGSEQWQLFHSVHAH